jgi:NAD(P)-dependent dehydrogenase (short-subunit alcohol dehydrogenase family)
MRWPCSPLLTCGNPTRRAPPWPSPSRPEEVGSTPWSTTPGAAPPVDAAAASPRFSESILELELLAPLHVSQAADATMQRRPGGGSIINIGSVSGIRPSPGSGVYGASKAGLVGLTQSQAVEWAAKVRLELVSGGLIRTEQAHLVYGGEAGIDRVAATVPLGRMGNPDDIADACLFLASPMASSSAGPTWWCTAAGSAPRPSGRPRATDRSRAGRQRRC